MFRLWIGNLGRYNEGNVIGDWISLPFTDDELYNLYARIGVGYFNEDGEYVHGLEVKGCVYEEVFIADYETDLGIEINQYDNIDKLNRFAEITESMDSTSRDALKALIEASDSWREAFQIYESGDFWYQQGLKDLDDLGVYVVSEGLFGHEIPDALMNYIDYEAIGRDWEMNGAFTSEGYVQIYR